MIDASAEIQLEFKEIVENLHKNKAVSTSSRQNIIVCCLHCLCVCVWEMKIVF